MSHDPRPTHPQWTRRRLLGVGGALTAGLLSGCRAVTPPPSLPAALRGPTPMVAPASAPRPLGVHPALAQKLAQMVLVGYGGSARQADVPLITDVRERAIGGVVLFEPGGPQQLRTLNTELSGLARVPLLIGVDQEGGQVARLGAGQGYPASPAPQVLGARQDADYTYASATATAAALKAAGINHNFAPVVDVNTNPANPVIGALGRSFSADPDVVAEQAAAFIRAHRDQGITTTLKHFPGHGSSRADSHVGFVDVTDTWQELELLPYRELIRLGLVDAIMTAHVFNAQLDMETVATLSKPILTGLLREQLGFDGVIFSDDMYMGAIARHFDFADAVVRAVEAGVDVITVSAHLADGQSVAARIVDILAAAVDDGRLSETRINDSYRRIVTLKQSWG